MSGKRMKKNKINISKIFLFVLFIAIMFGVVPALSKYKGATAEQIITILTKYSVNYRTSGGVIAEPEKFNSYVSQTGLTLPVEGEVTRTSYDFLGWYGDNDFTGEPVTKIESGETGDKLFFAAWQLAQYDLSVKVKDTDGNITSGLPSDYYIVIGKDEQGNDNVIDLDGKGTTTVGKYQTVSIKTTYYEDMILGGFTFLDSNGEEVEIEITTRHQDGDQYIYYDFKMPRGNTTLLFTKENTYVDISKSSITFEENVSIDGTSTTQSGFWYNSTITGMTPIKTDATKGRFYAWDYSEPFYVTSKGKETQNQLTLVNTITVYFKDCKLVARDGIDMSGRKVNGQVIENSTLTNLENILGDTLGNYGNIIINKDKVSNYTVNLHIEGDNIITTIFPNVYNYNSLYKGNINIYGEDEGKFYLGTMLDNANVTFTGVNLEEITEFESEYVIYIADGSEGAGSILFRYCTINTPNKRMYTFYGDIEYLSNGNLVSTKPTIADIGSSRQYGAISLTGSSSLYVRNDLLGMYNTIYVIGNSKLIVEGNILSMYSHTTSGAYINTSGYVIVKGNRFDGENITLKNGIVITNLLELGRTCNMIGGTLITNLISNPVCLYTRAVDSEGNYINNSEYTIELANYNNDNYLFNTYSQRDSAAGSYEFNGANIYIFGKYKILDEDRYNTNIKATDYDELSNVIEQVITNGKISTYPEMTESSKETVIIGNSRDIARYNVRTVKITGGNIYASGDMTFFNDVAVTGGNINCTGIFSTKRNLEITGGTIDAKEIGNSYNLTNTNNGLNYWKTTTITGGTLKTERLGATSKTVNTTGSNGTLIISGSAQIESETEIVTDTYINYVYDSNIFNNGNTVNNIRFSRTQGIGTMNNIDKLEIISPTLENDQYVFSKPTINGEEQKWKYKSLNGIELEYLSKYGYINGDTSNSNIYQGTQLNLYATKEKYNLIVHGSNYSGTNNGENIDFTNNIAEIKSGNQVIFKVNENVIDKTVVWYKDNSGTIYNAIEKEKDINKEDATITFNMPSADTEVWIVDGTEIESLTLDLSAYNVSILADGFATELNENRRDSSIFKYNGNITIAQSNIEGTNYVNRYTNPITPTNGNYNDKVTYNKIEIEGTNTNKIILKNIIQDTISEDDYAVIVKENVKTNLLIDGTIQLKAIKLPGISNLSIIGKNEHDVLNIKCTGTNSHSRQISNEENSVGSVYLKNLTIHQCQYGRLLYNTSNSKTEYLKLENCIYKNNYFYAYSGIARNVKNINIVNSEIELKGNGSYDGEVFRDIEYLNIEGGRITYTNGATNVAYSYSFISKVMNVKINNAILTDNVYNSNEYNINYQYMSISSLPETITLNGNSQLNSNYRYIFRDKLILNDTSSVNIGDDTTDGYLFAPNIEVNDQAQINSANVILSGYYNPTNKDSEAVTKSDAMKKLSANTDIKDGKNSMGLILNGGTVNAKEFVGGDVNAIITVNDGTINSSKIGTIGSLFGYARYLPKVGEEYVYTYSKIPEKGTKVTVNGGTVNVLENGYLGGMNAEVDIKGGIINLKDNSIIGMTDSDTTKLVNSITTQGNTPNELVDINITGGKIVGETGKINTAYSTLEIDATTSNPDIQIAEIIAENGTVNIQSIVDNYDNPLGEGEKVGAVINENLIGQNISISNGASVYAKNAITRTNTSSAVGSIKIGANSYLYTLHYGSEGSGTSTITNNGTIVGNRQYTIKYEMNDTYSDKAENTNPASYIYGNAVTLVDPTRTGYNFEGWYDESGNRVTKITSTDSGDKVFYAKWTEKSVEFVVKIKASDVGISKDEFAKQVDTNLGTLNANGDEFTYTQKVSIKYHALFNTGLLLSNYNLNSYSASGAKINNTTLNPDGDVLNLTSSGMTVTKEIMDYYIANKNEPIEILVCEFISNDIKTINIDE